jgi:hypothetical protein
MKRWVRTVMVCVAGPLLAASACGVPQIIREEEASHQHVKPDAAVGDGGPGDMHIKIPDGGNTPGCPSTCAEMNADCGFVTDTKCGGVIQCGSTCPTGQVCGGGGPSKCGSGMGHMEDAGSCTPSTCAELNADCGFVTDKKCGGVVDCGKCTGGETCGLGGPNLCGTGDGGSCEVEPATTCTGRGFDCGKAADNCGNLLDCGPTTCGAGEACLQGKCTSTACVVDPKTTCAGRGYSCGQAADNCGNLLTCGPAACSTPGWTCGGGSDQTGNKIPGVCGCTGVCSQIPQCATGKTTSLVGKVYDPAGRNPLYHVLVYVANDPTDPDLKTFPAGITCDVCGASAAGSPLISTPGSTDPPAGTYTGVDGSFQLDNVPAGKAITLVIQLGRWRRVFKVDVNTPCAKNTVTDKTLLMPSTQAQGNIPLMAMVTGNADSLECVLRKMGIADSEFTNPAQGGRIQFYQGTGNSGQTIDANTPTQDVLFAAPGGKPTINAYDMTILACQGSAYTETAGDQKTLRTYADQGGRVFTTHYSYTWLTNNDAMPGATVGTVDNWSEVAKWHVDENDRADTAVGIIDHVTNPKANAFQGWLEAVGASVPGSNQVGVVVIRHDSDSISTTPGQTQQWLYRNGDNAKTCKFNGGTCTTDASCGKVCSVRTQKACTVNSDCAAKVCKGSTGTSCNADADCSNIMGQNRGPCLANTCTQNTCTGTDYTGQHTPLHFTFNTPVNQVEDLTKNPPQLQCGRVLFSDFHVQDANEHGEIYPQECGKTCTTDASCQGTCDTTAHLCPWGSACTKDADCGSTCENGRCVDPMNAQEKLLEYMIFDLGSCVPPPKTCVPATTCPAGQDCGYAPDNCGGLVACGTCKNGEMCGVGNPPVANKCGKITCTPAAACPSGQECGFASDGCNGVIPCGMCPSGQTCTNGKCGSKSCSPKTCDDQAIECGSAGDQCGSQIQCPKCPTGQTCIGGKCTSDMCQPKSCQDQNIECGVAADGCGNKIPSCGMCAAGQLCISGKCRQVS